jgi:hypothetical protein
MNALSFAAVSNRLKRPRADRLCEPRADHPATMHGHIRDHRRRRNSPSPRSETYRWQEALSTGQDADAAKATLLTLYGALNGKVPHTGAAA